MLYRRSKDLHYCVAVQRPSLTKVNLEKIIMHISQRLDKHIVPINKINETIHPYISNIYYPL